MLHRVYAQPHSRAPLELAPADRNRVLVPCRVGLLHPACPKIQCVDIGSVVHGNGSQRRSSVGDVPDAAFIGRSLWQWCEAHENWVAAGPCGVGPGAVTTSRLIWEKVDQEMFMTDGGANGQGDKSGIGAGAIIGGISALVALIFILQNTGSGEVQFLAWSFTFPIWLWALILFLLGGVSGYFFHWQRIRARRKARRD